MAPEGTLPSPTSTIIIIIIITATITITNTDGEGTSDHRAFVVDDADPAAG